MIKYRIKKYILVSLFFLALSGMSVTSYAITLGEGPHPSCNAAGPGGGGSVDNTAAFGGSGPFKGLGNQMDFSGSIVTGLTSAFTSDGTGFFDGSALPGGIQVPPTVGKVNPADVGENWFGSVLGSSPAGLKEIGNGGLWGTMNVRSNAQRVKQKAYSSTVTQAMSALENSCFGDALAVMQRTGLIFSDNGFPSLTRPPEVPMPIPLCSFQADEGGDCSGLGSESLYNMSGSLGYGANAIGNQDKIHPGTGQPFSSTLPQHFSDIGGMHKEYLGDGGFKFSANIQLGNVVSNMVQNIADRFIGELANVKGFIDDIYGTIDGIVGRIEEVIEKAEEVAEQVGAVMDQIMDAFSGLAGMEAMSIAMKAGGKLMEAFARIEEYIGIAFEYVHEGMAYVQKGMGYIDKGMGYIDHYYELIVTNVEEGLNNYVYKYLDYANLSVDINVQPFTEVREAFDQARGLVDSFGNLVSDPVGCMNMESVWTGAVAGATDAAYDLIPGVEGSGIRLQGPIKPFNDIVNMTTAAAGTALVDMAAGAANSVFTGEPITPNMQGFANQLKNDANVVSKDIMKAAERDLRDMLSGPLDPLAPQRGFEHWKKPPSMDRTSGAASSRNIVEQINLQHTNYTSAFP